ncbi:PGPGW domain-containing protein [Ornithinimicrobium panacihumi]|uniref:PGPGW domain-containing protein n=1 Tax=Ornithinimicrobium panacihumi TaxID=2008449 RepID=UPI003F891983
MSEYAAGAAKRVLLEALGWTVLVIGILALFLPGPGLLLTFAGLAILSTQYAWAKRWTHPVKMKALRGAAEGVETPFRIFLSSVGALCLVAVGVVWLLSPPAPGWWPLREDWWLFGGRPVAITMLVSSAIAVGLLIYSVHRFFGKPEAVAEIDRMDARYKEELAISEHLEAMEARTEAQEARRVADRSTRAARQEANRADPTTGQV